MARKYSIRIMFEVREAPVGGTPEPQRWKKNFKENPDLVTFHLT